MKLTINGVPTRICPVTLIGGAQAFVVPHTVDKTGTREYSGPTLGGVEVHSPHVTPIAGTKDVLIESKGGQFTMDKAEHELMCSGAAKDYGYKVERPALQTAAA